MQADLTIHPNGSLSFVWQDELQPMLDLGTPDIRRVSHVEPTPDGQWTADLSPVNGPTLGPYRLRQQALDAEREWLERHG